MNKSILAIAVAATMAAPAAMAETTVYGNAHVSINDFDSNPDLDMTSNTSSVGVKGSEDLGDGLKAIYKMEFQVDVADSTGGGNALTQRDMFVGLKGGMGTIKFGIMSSNYKQMGGKVDPLYRTRLEGRGFLGTQSSLHSGRGIDRGRQTNTVQYTSPKMGGISLVANTTVSNSTDETNGIGVRWSNKDIMAYLDWIDNDAAGDAIKLGGKFSAKAFSVALQYEMLEDTFGDEEDYIFAAGTFNIDKNNAIILTVGQGDFTSPGFSADYTGVAVAYNHKLSKMTNVYVGYGDRSDDDGIAGGDEDVITAGIKKKF